MEEDYTTFIAKETALYENLKMILSQITVRLGLLFYNDPINALIKGYQNKQLDHYELEAKIQEFMTEVRSYSYYLNKGYEHAKILVKQKKLQSAVEEYFDTEIEKTTEQIANLEQIVSNLQRSNYVFPNGYGTDSARADNDSNIQE